MGTHTWGLLALGSIGSCGTRGKNVKMACVKVLCIINIGGVSIITIFNEPKREHSGWEKEEERKHSEKGEVRGGGPSVDSWALEERAWGWGRVPTAPRQQKAAEHRLWVPWALISSWGVGQSHRPLSRWG